MKIPILLKHFPAVYLGLFASQVVVWFYFYFILGADMDKGWQISTLLATAMVWDLIAVLPLLIIISVARRTKRLAMVSPLASGISAFLSELIMSAISYQLIAFANISQIGLIADFILICVGMALFYIWLFPTVYFLGMLRGSSHNI